MRTSPCAIVLTFLSCVGCGTQPLTPSRAAAVESGVRAFMGTVAHDVTQDGPAAWRKHFADSPAFFMAADGHLAFPDSASATAGIQNLTRTIKHIELQWGNDLRVDPLTADLAAVAASYHETIVGATARSLDASGYFTATAEHRQGGWQFRNAHWSSAAPMPTLP
jgi:hypothetical protein